jgi:hypothetical protein
MLGALGLTIVSVSGCVIVRDDDGRGIRPAPPAAPDDTAPASTGKIRLVDIDAGATLSATPGDGVGVFVEYESGGHWTIWTSSDIGIGGAARSFDILATAIDDTSVLSNLAGVDLGAEDQVLLTAENQVQLLTETELGTDGVTFDTTPGAIIELDVLVDGASDPRIIYWVGGGVLHAGAPSNPIDFWPSAP